MRVIGIDPGSRVCGYGVLEAQNGEVTYLISGCIAPNPALPFNQRLKVIYDGLLKVIDQHTPDVMSIEDIFFAKNAKSAIKLGQAKGVALLAGSNAGISIYEYAPTKVKLALTGRGRANKAEVQNMLSKLLGVTTWESQDASDAVAIALCHIHISQIETRLGKEFVQPRRKRRRFTLDDLPS
ncbi:MAG: crossover junction endodeoxyribonuclease RuvC [Candidatus Dadabacteria bacterium]|nr:crossover junction endodeoxyribonuclease RuvC [Candidatus Dadabacteria bacterium]